MSDQATLLRGLMTRRAPSDDAGDPSVPRARTLAIASGKGGVGKSCLTLNLGIALARQGARVCLVDANLGLGNLDLLLGLNGYWNLSHVVTGARSLQEILLTGPEGIHLVPGASGLAETADCSLSAQREIVDQLDELERSHDLLLIDTGAGIHRTVREFLLAAETAIIVATPEPTSLADAYATIKSLAGAAELDLEILVNQAASGEQASRIIERLQITARTFVHRTVSAAGWIPRDVAVSEAVYARTPFVLSHPDSPAAHAVERLARRYREPSIVASSRSPFFPQLCRRLARRTT